MPPLQVYIGICLYCKNKLVWGIDADESVSQVERQL